MVTVGRGHVRGVVTVGRGYGRGVVVGGVVAGAYGKGAVTVGRSYLGAWLWWVWSWQGVATVE